MNYQMLKSIAERTKQRNNLNHFDPRKINPRTLDQLTDGAFHHQEWLESAMFENAMMNQSLSINAMLEDLTETTDGIATRYLKDNFFDEYLEELDQSRIFCDFSDHLVNELVKEDFNAIDDKLISSSRQIVEREFLEDPSLAFTKNITHHIFKLIHELMFTSGQEYQECQYLLFNYFDQETRYSIGLDKDISKNSLAKGLISTAFHDSFSSKEYEHYNHFEDLIKERIKN